MSSAALAAMREVRFLAHMDPCFASTLQPPEDEKPRNWNQTRSYIKDENENESEHTSAKWVALSTIQAIAFLGRSSTQVLFCPPEYERWDEMYQYIYIIKLYTVHTHYTYHTVPPGKVLDLPSHTISFHIKKETTATLLRLLTIRAALQNGLIRVHFLLQLEDTGHKRSKSVL